MTILGTSCLFNSLRRIQCVSINHGLYSKNRFRQVKVSVREKYRSTTVRFNVCNFTDIKMNTVTRSIS